MAPFCGAVSLSTNNLLHLLAAVWALCRFSLDAPRSLCALIVDLTRHQALAVNDVGTGQTGRSRKQQSPVLVPSSVPVTLSVLEACTRSPP